MLLSAPTGVVRDPAFYLGAKGIVARTLTEVTHIDRSRKVVTARDLKTGQSEDVAYDKLILATGATAVLPPVPGVTLQGVTTLQSMHDADFLRRIRDEGTIRKAVVVGGGLIGIETCEALHLAGIESRWSNGSRRSWHSCDWQLAELVENHIHAKGARVITGNG